MACIAAVKTNMEISSISRSAGLCAFVAIAGVVAHAVSESVLPSAVLSRRLSVLLVLPPAGSVVLELRMIVGNYFLAFCCCSISCMRMVRADMDCKEGRGL
jgi:hypothetical protein